MDIQDDHLQDQDFEDQDEDQDQPGADLPPLPKYDPENDPNPHPSIANPDMEWEWPAVNEVPKATPEDLRAAEILGRLIKYGYVPSPEPRLPDDWAEAYDAVRDVVDEDQRSRFQAFTSSLLDDPLFVLKLHEVQKAMPRTIDRTLQTREAYTADELMAPPPELDWSIPQLFAQPSVNFLIGQPGAKKTFLATDLAVCVAMGRPWLGRPLNQCQVLFIDEETGLYQLWGRFASALKAHQAPWGLPLHAISLGGYDLRDPDDAERLVHRALTYNARFIIIDALANLMRGAPDSNMAAVQPVLFQLRRLSEIARATILVLHHANKEGEFRGTSAIAAAADLMLMVRSDPASDYVEMNTIKARFYAPAPFAARASFTTAEDGLPRVIFHSAELQPDALLPPPPLPAAKPSAAMAVLTYLSQHESATRQTLTAGLPSYSQSTLRNTLQQLKRSGLIKRLNGNRRGAKAIYAISQ